MIDLAAESLKTLTAVPVVLRRLVAGVDDDTARLRPEPGEWSVVEVVAHLADVDERAMVRIGRMLAEDHPHLEPFDPDRLADDEGYRQRSLAAELDRFEDSRRRHLALLIGLDDARWERTGRHGEHGEMTVRDYVAHCAAEDVDHLAQIARTLDAVAG